MLSYSYIHIHGHFKFGYLSGQRSALENHTYAEQLVYPLSPQ